MKENSMNREDLSIFALGASRDFGERVSACLGIPLSALEEREFEDGEHKARPLVSVRGKDVFVIQSLYGDSRQSVNDKLCRLLFFLGALRDASAASVTAVAPYLCYARKDRKSKSRDPVTTRYVAALLEAVGADRVVTMDVHNLAAFQNAFRIHTDHLEAKNLFVEYFVPLVRPLIQQAEVVVVSPDAGGVKRAEDFRQALGRSLLRQLFDGGPRSDGIKIALRRLGHCCVPLRHHDDLFFLRRHCRLHCRDRSRSPERERQHQIRKQHGVFDGKQRHAQQLLFTHLEFSFRDGSSSRAR
jgi:N-terminal domain of ribose phosphate pyrophosphokinase